MNIDKTLDLMVDLGERWNGTVVPAVYLYNIKEISRVGYNAPMTLRIGKADGDDIVLTSRLLSDEEFAYEKMRFVKWTYGNPPQEDLDNILATFEDIMGRKIDDVATGIDTLAKLKANIDDSPYILLQLKQSSMDMEMGVVIDYNERALDQVDQFVDTARTVNLNDDEKILLYSFERLLEYMTNIVSEYDPIRNPDVLDDDIGDIIDATTEETEDGK